MQLLHLAQGFSTLLVRDIRTKMPQIPKHYILEDLSLLSAAFETVGFQRAAAIGRCGYDYDLQFLGNVRTSASALLCFICKRFTFKEEFFSFEPLLFKTMLEKVFSPLYETLVSFDNAAKGIAYWEEIKNEKLLLLNSKLPDWLFYEGYFETIPIKAKSREKAQKILHKIITEIDTTTPYRIEVGYSSDDFVVFYVYCQKVLYQQCNNLHNTPFTPFTDFKLSYLHQGES